MSDNTLKSALAEIKKAAIDLTELNVQTFVGSAGAVTTKAGLDSLESILTPSEGDDTALSVQLNLAMQTVLKFDGDSMNFIDPNLVGDNAELVAVHKESVLAGLEQRQALVDMFKSLIID